MPHHLGSELNDDLLEWIEWVPFLLSLGNWFFDYVLYRPVDGLKMNVS
jgi:hypothetical protein